MRLLKHITLDNLIMEFEGIVVMDRKNVFLSEEAGSEALNEIKRQQLKQDKMILGALKCAKANGFVGEE